MSFKEFETKDTELQAEILELSAKIKAKEQEINNLDPIKELQELKQERQNKMALYNGFTKSAIGLADGEPMSVFQIAKAIRKITSLD